MSEMAKITLVILRSPVFQGVSTICVYAGIKCVLTSEGLENTANLKSCVKIHGSRDIFWS